jgi:amino acid transporter
MVERATLNKSLKARWVWAIAFGSSIGWGAFILPTDWIKQAGPFGAILGLLIGALLMIMIGVSYGILIKKFPVSGGEFTYTYISLGRTFAFICGWFLTLGYVSIVALNASAFSLLLKFLFPNFMKQIMLYSIAGWEVYLPEVILSSGIIILFALLNIMGTNVSGKFQFVFSILLIAGVLVLSLSTYSLDTASISNMKPFFAEGKSIMTSILLIVAIAPWAYVGFDNIPQAAEEFKFNAEKSFKLISLSLLSSGCVYSLMIGLTSWTFSSESDLDSQNLWGTGDIIAASLGQVGVMILSLSILMGIFTGLNGFYHSSSRLLFSMARAKIIPRIFSRIHSKHGTPYFGIIFTAMITLFAPWFGREVLLWVVDMSSIGVSIAYFFTCFTAYKILSWKRVPNIQKEYAPVKKIIALLGIMASLTFASLLLLPFSPAFLSKPAQIVLIVWIVLGVVFYFLNLKKLNNIPKEEMDYLVTGVKEENIS